MTDKKAEPYVREAFPLMQAAFAKMPDGLSADEACRFLTAAALPACERHGAADKAARCAESFMRFVEIVVMAKVAKSMGASSMVAFPPPRRVMEPGFN